MLTLKPQLSFVDILGTGAAKNQGTTIGSWQRRFRHSVMADLIDFRKTGVVSLSQGERWMRYKQTPIATRSDYARFAAQGFPPRVAV